MYQANALSTLDSSKSNFLSRQIVPVNFGLKYRPPKLGLQYYIQGNERATFVHEVSLEFVTQHSDVNLVTKDLID